MTKAQNELINEQIAKDMVLRRHEGIYYLTILIEQQKVEANKNTFEIDDEVLEPLSLKSIKTPIQDNASK
jgi:hypothetical protein